MDPEAAARPGHGLHDEGSRPAAARGDGAEGRANRVLDHHGSPSVPMFTRHASRTSTIPSRRRRSSSDRMMRNARATCSRISNRPARSRRRARADAGRVGTGAGRQYRADRLGHEGLDRARHRRTATAADRCAGRRCRIADEDDIGAGTIDLLEDQNVDPPSSRCCARPSANAKACRCGGSYLGRTF